MKTILFEDKTSQHTFQILLLLLLLWRFISFTLIRNLLINIAKIYQMKDDAFVWNSHGWWLGMLTATAFLYRWILLPKLTFLKLAATLLDFKMIYIPCFGPLFNTLHEQSSCGVEGLVVDGIIPSKLLAIFARKIILSSVGIDQNR